MTKDEVLLLDLDSDPEVMKYLTGGKPSSLSQIQETLKRVETLLIKHQGRYGVWAGHLKSTDDFIGWFHFRPCKKDPENTKKIELGYRLKNKFWGKGYATEVSYALIKKGFLELGVDEVFATTMKKNIGSRRVMEKVGLEFESEFFNPDFKETNDLDVKYSIKKKDWLKRSAT